MVRRAEDIQADPAIGIVNPDEAVTAENFAAWLDDRQKGSPVTTSVNAAETLAEIRAAGEE